jgi:hypothetical protein
MATDALGGCVDLCPPLSVISFPSPVACCDLGRAKNVPVLKIISGAAFSVFEFSVENHLMRVIAADNSPITKSSKLYDVIRLNAGARYEVEICYNGTGTQVPQSKTLGRLLHEHG